MPLNKTLSFLYDQQTLSREEARTLLGEISEGQHDPHQISSFMTVFKMRNITVDELTGFRDCLLDRCHRVDLSNHDAIDLCGTGGDGKDTFNISTAASFVVAGAGYRVAKHGNYGVSSICGSSNVLEKLGYRFSNDTDTLNKEISEAHITFLHAPLFHPAMKEVAPIRKALGVRTFFNMLGPMVNPSQPPKQLVGVFSLKLQRYYQYIYEQETKSYRIVHSLDGYDEISLTSEAKVISPEGEMLITPAQLQSRKLTQAEIHGGQTIDEAVKIFVNVLSNQGTEAQTNVVLANAALAIQCYDTTKDIESATAEARASIESGSALHALKKLTRQ